MKDGESIAALKKLDKDKYRVTLREIEAERDAAAKRIGFHLDLFPLTQFV